MNENPHYRFRRPGTVKSFNKSFNKTNESLLSGSVITHFPDIKQQFIEGRNESTIQSRQNSTITKEHENSSLNKPLGTNVISTENKQNSTHPVKNMPNDLAAVAEPTAQTFAPSRPKTSKSDRKKAHSTSSNINNNNQNSLESFESASVLKELTNNSSQLNMPAAAAAVGDNLKAKKSILKQPSALPAVVNPQKSIVFAEEKLAAAAAKTVLPPPLPVKRATTKSTKSNQVKQESGQQSLSSIEIMMGTSAVLNEDDQESQDSVTSFNPADTVITNNVISNITEQTLAANIKLVNDFKELEEQSLDLIEAAVNDDINQSK